MLYAKRIPWKTPLLLIACLALVFSTVYFSISLAEKEQMIKNINADFGKKISILEKKLLLMQEQLLEKQTSLSLQNQALKLEISSLKEQQLLQNQNLLDLITELEQKSSTEFSELKKAVSDVNASTDFSKIASASLPSVVSVSTNLEKGSGFFVSGNGVIATNYHVVDSGGAVTVALSDDRTFNASIAGFDKEADIAVLKIQLKGNSFLELGNSDSLMVGERVIALGSPFGLDFTVTQGIVSSKKRSVSDSSYSFIQTDVPLNPGNSGGPLINSSGKVVGINTLKILNAESLAFALPSNSAKPVIERLSLQAG